MMEPQCATEQHVVALRRIDHEVKGQAIYAFVTLGDEAEKSGNKDAIKKALVAHVRSQIGKSSHSSGAARPARHLAPGNTLVHAAATAASAAAAAQLPGCALGRSIIHKACCCTSGRQSRPTCGRHSAPCTPDVQCTSSC